MAESNAITVGHTVKLNIVVYKNEPVLTLAMIDDAHGRASGTASKRFGENKKRFLEGKHFHSVPHSEAAELSAYGVNVPPRGLTLITKRGYLLLVKSFTDDLAWEVQEQLVDHYFEGQLEAPKPEPLPEYITPSQYQDLRSRIQMIARRTLNHSSAEYDMWNKLRFDLNVETATKIHAHQYDQAVAIVDEIQKSYFDGGSYELLKELSSYLIRTHVCDGVPLTGAVKKGWKEKMQCMLPTPLDWRKLALTLENDTESTAV